MTQKDSTLISHLKSISNDKMMLMDLGQLITNRLTSVVMIYELLEDEFNNKVIKDDMTNEFIKEARQDFDNSAKDLKEMIDFLRNYAHTSLDSLKDNDD